LRSASNSNSNSNSSSGSGSNARKKRQSDAFGGSALLVEGDDRDREMAIIQNGLIGIEEVVTDFPKQFRALQKQILLLDTTTNDDNDNDDTNNDGMADPSKDTVPSMWAIYQMCNLSCKAMEYALGYREARSETIYDLSSTPPTRRGWGSSGNHHEGGGSGCYPWTSNDEILSTLEDNTMALQKLTNDPARVDILRHPPTAEAVAELVREMAHALLAGHRDITPSRRDEGRYDAAKRSAVSLVRWISPRSTDDGGVEADVEVGEDLAFRLSLDHGYFDGVVEICHHRFDRTAGHRRTSPYDIGVMLSPDRGTDVDGEGDEQTYGSLYDRPDYTTGLTFPKFVFRWYTDRNMASEVFELGGNCPEILSEYMEEDTRLSDLRWLQHLKTGSYDKASHCLMGLVSSGIVPIGGGKNTVPPSMESRQLVLSLAKLSSMVNTDNNNNNNNNNNTNGGRSNITKEEGKIMDQNLELCKAQEILAGMTDRPEVVLKTAMSAGDLISMSLTLIDALDDVQDTSRACLAALSVVDVIQASSRSFEAGKIWAKSIESDARTWADMTQDWNEMADDERIVMVHNTVFFHLARDYYGHLDYGSTVDTVGFKNIRVREEAFRLLTLPEGMDEILENVLEILI